MSLIKTEAFKQTGHPLTAEYTWKSRHLWKLKPFSYQALKNAFNGVKLSILTSESMGMTHLASSGHYRNYRLSCIGF